MGCGKSKHDVASGNTVLQRKKSNVDSTAGQENGTETKGINNNNNNIVVVDSETSKVVEQNNNENVKEINGVGGKAPEITNVQEDKALEKTKEADAAEKKTQEVVVTEGTPEKSEDGKDVLLEKNEQEVTNASDAATQENKAEGEETLVKGEETKDTNQEENLTKETTEEETFAKEEETDDTNVSTSEGEPKDLKAEQGQ